MSTSKGLPQPWLFNAVADATVAANSGGGNHLLLPVALGQRLLHDSPTAGFGGGIVRVEGTNLSWVNDMYPGKIFDRNCRRFSTICR